jgi:low density lipoprotein receptor adapter protein 1
MENIFAECSQAKASGKKLPRVSLTVGLSGIRMVDNATEEIHLDVSIYRYAIFRTKDLQHFMAVYTFHYLSNAATSVLFFCRISYCSADATYDHVFAFIATNSNETMECHAFLCPKRKVVSYK